MPIVFSKGVVEKIVEKVVEKTVYVAVSLSREFKTAYSIISKPSKPVQTVIASTLLSLTKFIYSLYNMLEKLRFYVASNPYKPSASAIGATSYLLSQSYSSMPKPTVGYYRASNPNITAPQSLITMFMSIVYGGCMDAKKTYPYYSIAVNPSKPSRTTAGTVYPSVGVRKSP